MLIFFTKKINSFNKFSLVNFNQTEGNAYIQGFMPKLTDIPLECKCPNCSAVNNFTYHASYKRYISFNIDKEIITYTVNVIRVRCTSCDTTHALLPNFIVPYTIMSKDSILSIASSAAKSSVLKTASSLNITYQLIYSYIALLLSFFPNIDILNKLHIYTNNLTQQYYLYNCAELCNMTFCLDYIKYFRRPFLMQKYRNKAAGPPYIGVAQEPSLKY